MELFTTELTSLITGGVSIATYVAALFFGLVGFAIAAIVDYMNRKDKEAKFNITYWAKRNGSFLVLLLMTIPSFLRFQADLIVAITEQTGNSLSFIEDRFLWFLIGGLLFRVIFHHGNKLINKLMSK